MYKEGSYEGWGCVDVWSEWPIFVPAHPRNDEYWWIAYDPEKSVFDEARELVPKYVEGSTEVYLKIRGMLGPKDEGTITPTREVKILQFSDMRLARKSDSCGLPAVNIKVDRLK
jgi:hypothetical protein